MANQVDSMDAVILPSNEDRGNSLSESSAPSSAYISSEADLIAFTRLPLEERVFTAQLRGVLAESALTGRVRYKWPLLRPLVDFVLEQVLTAYDAETRVEVGPPGPDSVSETIERFQKLLSAFSDAPWTFQRLCEILLEPKRQYSRLPKLVLAIEKCLLVTTEQPPTDPDHLPPPPLCSSLGPVNTNPPPVYTNAHHSSHGDHGPMGPAGGADDSAAFTNSLIDVRGHHPHHHHHHVGNHVGTPEHIEEDHWPEGLSEGKGAFKAAGVVGVGVGVGVGLHGALRPGHGGGGGGGAPGHGSPGGSGSGGGGGAAGAGQPDAYGAAHHPAGVAPAVGPHTLLGALQHHGSPGAAGGGSPGGRRNSGGGGALLPVLAGDGPAVPVGAAAAGAASGAGSGGGDDAMAIDNAAPTPGSSSTQGGGGGGAIGAAPAVDGQQREAAASAGEEPTSVATTGPAAAEAAGSLAAKEVGSGRVEVEAAGASGAPAAAAAVGSDGDVEMEAMREGGLAPARAPVNGGAGLEAGAEVVGAEGDRTAGRDVPAAAQVAEEASAPMAVAEEREPAAEGAAGVAGEAKPALAGTVDGSQPPGG